MPQKPTRPSAPAKEQGEYAIFIGALKKVLSVPHLELKTMLAAEKRKRTVSVRASGGKG